MIDNCYTFKELKEKFGWDTTLNEIKKQITYASRRGVVLEKAFKKGPTYFRIISLDSYSDEIWKTVPRNLNLEVSNYGRVRDIETQAFLGRKNTNGYMEVKRYNTIYLVHRLVMETFTPIENSQLYYVDHKNGIRTDNQLENLRWVKATENLLFRNKEWQDLSEIVAKLVQQHGYEETKKKLNSLL